MNLYGKLPQEQAMQTLIHDTNSSLQLMEFNLKKLDEWLKENGKSVNSAVPFVIAEYLRTNIKRTKAAIDEYYVKFKNDFDTTLTEANEMLKNPATVEQAKAQVNKLNKKQG